MLLHLHLCWAVAKGLSCPLFIEAQGQLFNINGGDGGSQESHRNQKLGDLKRRMYFQKQIMKKDKLVEKEMETVYKRPPGT